MLIMNYLLRRIHSIKSGAKILIFLIQNNGSLKNNQEQRTKIREFTFFGNYVRKLQFMLSTTANNNHDKKSKR